MSSKDGASAPPVFYGTPGREPSEVLGRAFTVGCGGDYCETRILERSRPAAFYGMSKYTKPLHQTVQAKGIDYYYIDNGYFRPGHYGGFYRITRNAAQHDGSGSSPGDRWQRLSLSCKPWRRSGRHIVVVGQSNTYHALRGRRLGDWVQGVCSTIAEHTDRPIIYRPKPLARYEFKRPAYIDFENAWCIVSHTSNVLVEAVLAGVPVFATGDCAAKAMSETDLTRIESPRYPEREQWLWNLAHQQWTLEEIRTGRAWASMAG